MFAEAEALTKPSLTTLRAQFGPEHKDTRAAEAFLFRLYTAWGKPEQAATKKENARWPSSLYQTGSTPSPPT